MQKYITYYEFHRKLDAIDYRATQEDRDFMRIYSIYNEYDCVGWINTQIEGDMYISSRNIHLVELVLAYAKTPIAERNTRP